MDVIIRNIETKDYPIVKKLLTDLIRAEATINPTRLQEPSPEYGTWYLQKCLEFEKNGVGCIGVAEIDGKIAGCVAGHIIKQTKEDLLERKTMTLGSISDIYVYDVYRGQGIGRKLLTFIENFFTEKQCDYVEISVCAKNIRGHKLYTDFGYEDYLVEMIKKF